MDVYHELSITKPRIVIAAKLLVFVVAAGLLGHSTNCKAYVLAGTKWGDPTMGTSGGVVSWSFLPTGTMCLDATCTHVSQIMEAGYEQEFQRAFAAWEAVADIQFLQVASGQKSDIGIGAHNFNWGAHTYYPTFGEIHFSTLFDWTINDGFFQIFPIALHEIGHVLGLEHAPLVGTVMGPQLLPPGIGYVYDLAADDIAGAQWIYGRSPIQARAPVSPSVWLVGAGLLALRATRKKLSRWRGRHSLCIFQRTSSASFS